MANLVGTITPSGTLVGGIVGVGGGGSIEKTTIHFTNDNGTITCDTPMSTIIETYNSGALMEGVLFDVESGVYAVLDLFVAQDMGDFLLVQFSCIGDNGDNSLTYIIIGTSSDGEDSWNLMIRNLLSDNDLQNYATKTYVDNISNFIVDLSSYSVGDTISDSSLIAKIEDDRCIIKHSGLHPQVFFKYAGYNNGIRLYTVMDDLEGAEFILLAPDGSGNYILYEKGTTQWEVTSHKVTTINSNSKDSEYPSAKAVYTLVNNEVGNIETILNTLNSGGGAS